MVFCNLSVTNIVLNILNRCSEFTEFDVLFLQHQAFKRFILIKESIKGNHLYFQLNNRMNKMPRIFLKMVAHLAHLTRTVLNTLIIRIIHLIECAYINRATAQMSRGL